MHNSPPPPQKKKKKKKNWDVADLSFLNILALFVQNDHEGAPLA